MKLSKSLLNNQDTLNLPEKVLQFGTGVLLRGLCDYFIDNANKQGIFNGRIVVVKSTDSGGSDAFSEQDNLYTLSIKGISKGKAIEENVICSPISRVLSAKSEWQNILATAHKEEMNIVISNTTEVGIQYVEESIFQCPPASFPAKLTAWLYERYKAKQSGVVVVPTELIVNNADKLKTIVLQLCTFNQLENSFVQWLQTECSFCNSLVDRIVPGKPKGDALDELNKSLGYEDELVAITEVYALWAIQGGEDIREKLSFYEANAGVKIEKDIEQYRELKLRLLNGTHTLMSGIAYLSGFQTVKDVMNDELMEKYILILMLTEIAPAIPYPVDTKVSQRYGREVLDRFRNPYLEHFWLSITLQYTMKMRMRNIPLLLNYYEVFDTVPQYFARGFAAYLLFMKATKVEDGKFFGENNGIAYPIQCDSAAYFYEVWKTSNINTLVRTVLSNKDLWGEDLTNLEGFAENVETHLSNMMLLGVREVASALNVYA